MSAKVKFNYLGIDLLTARATGCLQRETVYLASEGGGQGQLQTAASVLAQKGLREL